MSVRRTVAALLVCQCVLTAGLTLSLPFFALYLHQRRGLSMDMVGLAISLMMLTTAAAQSLAGELSDLLGSKRVMVAAVAMRGLMSASMAAAMVWDWPVASLVMINVLSAFLGNFFDPAARSWLADACPPADRLKAFGWQRVAVNLGWAIGPAVGGLLAAKSYPALFAVSGAVCLACAVYMRSVVHDFPPRRHGEAFRWAEPLQAASDRRFLRFCLCGLLIAVVHAQLVVGLSVHAVGHAGLSERQVGLLFATNGLVVVLLQHAAGGLLVGHSLIAVVAGGCLLYAVGYAGVGFAQGFALMALAVVVVTLGEILVTPGVHTLAANMAPERFKGRYIGFYGLTHQLGSALGPLLGGVGLQHLSPRWPAAPWLLVGTVGAAASLGFLQLRGALSPEEEGR